MAENAYRWQDWADTHPLELTVIPAQDDYLIEKPEVIMLARGGVYIQATRAELEALLDNAPLDPEPWVVHSIDSGDVRFEREEDCWGGYRANFEPRTELGYTDRRNRYAD